VSIKDSAGFDIPQEQYDHTLAALIRATDTIEQLQADNARLRKDYEEGLEAWRQNNAFFGEWIGKIAATLDIVLDDLMYKDHQRVIDFAREVLREYKAARGAKLITPRSTTY
jgi:sulfur relay (sulfurtransferase) DsrC/TusE family protein